jgi:signal transduction histidine kinase
MGVHLLRAEPPPAEEKKVHTLALIGAQVSRLQRMVDDFLDARSIESGQLGLQLQLLDVRTLAQEAVDLNAGSSIAHRIVYSAPNSPVQVFCDGARIAQVLNNLVSNAIKYSPRGGDVLVSVVVAGDEATLAVRDSGIGIAPADTKHIFEPFRRTRASREIAPGVGLGLSVARRIVEAHGGRIEVDSKLGAGSTFRVHLPLSGPEPRGCINQT